VKRWVLKRGKDSSGWDTNIKHASEKILYEELIKYYMNEGGGSHWEFILQGRVRWVEGTVSFV